MKIIEKASKEIQDAIDNIMSCFNGEDGGLNFVKLCTVINFLSEQIKSNNVSQKEAAQQILNVILQFSRLIDYAKNA